MQKLIKLGIGFWVLTLAAPYSAEVELLFSLVEQSHEHRGMAPQVRREDIAKKLRESLAGAKSRIFIAIYSITHIKITNAIIKAKNKVITDAKTDREQKIEIKVIVDKKAMNDENVLASIQELVAAGIHVRTFNPSKIGKEEGFMHNKYAIIDNIFWTGSFNFTNGAQDKNQENVAIMKGNQELIEQTLHSFNILWEYSDRVMPLAPLPPHNLKDEYYRKRTQDEDDDRHEGSKQYKRS